MERAVDGTVTRPHCGTIGLSGSQTCQACGMALSSGGSASGALPPSQDERLPRGPLALLASIVLAAALCVGVLISPGQHPSPATPAATPTMPAATATGEAIDGDQSGGGLLATVSPSSPTATATPRSSKGGGRGGAPTATPIALPTETPIPTATLTPVATPTHIPTPTATPNEHGG